MASRKMISAVSQLNNRKGSQTFQPGNASFDNTRENIDPHVKTKVVSTQEIKAYTVNAANLIASATISGANVYGTTSISGASIYTPDFDGVQIDLDDGSSNTWQAVGGGTTVVGGSGTKAALITLKTYSDTGWRCNSFTCTRYGGTSSSPTSAQDGDVIFKFEPVIWNGSNTDITGAFQAVQDGSPGASGTACKWRWICRDGSDNQNQLLNISNSEVVINESGKDTNFRVESDGNANMIFVDAGTNKVGIGKNSPATELEVNGTISGSTLSASDGWSGTFTNGDGDTVTVTDGIITNVA